MVFCDVKYFFFFEEQNRNALKDNVVLITDNQGWQMGRLGHKQGSQYCTGGCTGLASGTIYFGYRSIPMYRFGFTAILYIYIYVCMYVCVCVYIYYNKYKSLP